MLLSASYWKKAGVLFACVALAKGLRRPNLWALTQLQMNYSTGFVKRGLLGQSLRLLHLRSLAQVQGFCLLQLAVLLLLLALLVRQSGLLSTVGGAVLVCAAAGSYALTFLAHLIGYLDLTLYTLALAVLLVRRPSARLALAVPLCCAGLMVHEIFLFTALPPILLSLWLDGTQQDWVQRGRLKQGALPQGTLAAAGLLVCCLGLAVLISFKGHLSQTALARYKLSVLASSDYPVDSGELEVVLGLSTRENLRLNASVISHEYWWWAELAVAIATCGPLLWLLLAALRRNAPTGLRCGPLYAASLSPLLLNLIGWDNVRWMALTVLSAFISLCVLRRSVAGIVPYRAGAREAQWSVLILGLGLASGHGLMDHTDINAYPFFPSYIRHRVIAHDGSYGTIL